MRTIGSLSRAACLFTATALLLAPSVAAAQRGADDTTAQARWGRYVDKEFGLSFDFPGHVFKTAAVRGERQGLVFYTDDRRAFLQVFALKNQRGDTPRRFLDRITASSQDRFSYVRVTSRFFVTSGTNAQRIFYRRCNFARDFGGRVLCVQMDYPAHEKRAWDQVVTRVSLSLRPVAPD